MKKIKWDVAVQGAQWVAIQALMECFQEIPLDTQYTQHLNHRPRMYLPTMVGVKTTRKFSPGKAEIRLIYVTIRLQTQRDPESTVETLFPWGVGGEPSLNGIVWVARTNHNCNWLPIYADYTLENSAEPPGFSTFEETTCLLCAKCGKRKSASYLHHALEYSSDANLCPDCKMEMEVWPAPKIS